jgi:hypothetical protein
MSTRVSCPWCAKYPSKPQRAPARILAQLMQRCDALCRSAATVAALQRTLSQRRNSCSAATHFVAAPQLLQLCNALCRSAATRSTPVGPPACRPRRCTYLWHARPPALRLFVAWPLARAPVRASWRRGGEPEQQSRRRLLGYYNGTTRVRKGTQGVLKGTHGYSRGTPVWARGVSPCSSPSASVGAQPRELVHLDERPCSECRRRYR